MSKPRRKDRKAYVKGIASEVPIKRYARFLQEEFKVAEVPDKGEYVVLHRRIKLPERRAIDIIVYTTDRIYVSSSPYIDDADFDRMATRIIQLAQQATAPLEEIRPISVQRAKSIFEFARRLNLDNEYERMVAIILADTSNEIVLREQMKARGIKGAPLEEGIPDKIGRLKKKGIHVLNEREIRDLRETRNRVVHYGEIPDKSQAEKALRIAQIVLKSVSKE